MDRCGRFAADDSQVRQAPRVAPDRQLTPSYKNQLLRFYGFSLASSMKLHFHWNPTLITPNTPEIAQGFEIHLATVNRIVKKTDNFLGNG